MGYVIGIDVSTTATKALLVDEAGTVVASASAEYAYETPQPLWSEQDPELWWEATVDSIRDLLATAAVSGAEIDAVGVTGQMHGLVLLDGKGRPLRPAILWNDQRSGPECDELRDRLGRDRLIAITGNDALPGFTASKIMWVRNHEPEILGDARTVLLPKDYVRFRLTSQLATDKAGASGTQLFDLAARNWSDEVVAAVGIHRALLPETFEGDAVCGHIAGEAALATGLERGTSVVAGAGDQAANAIGTGVVNPGQIALSLGTSGVVFAASGEPAIDPHGRVHAFCHGVPERWHMMGVMLSAAGSMRWLRDTIARGVPFETLSAEAASVEPGAEGLIFLPYLTGERTPHPDPLARGAFIGLTVRHSRAHLIRAVMEGVAFGLKDGYQLMRNAGVPAPDQIRASGGGTRSPVWRQIIADVLDADLTGLATAEGAGYGAAILAAAGAGWSNTVGELGGMWVRTTETTVRGDDDYSRPYGIYTEQYELLRDTFTQLADV